MKDRGINLKVTREIFKIIYNVFITYRGGGGLNSQRESRKHVFNDKLFI